MYGCTRAGGSTASLAPSCRLGCAFRRSWNIWQNTGNVCVCVSTTIRTWTKSEPMAKGKSLLFSTREPSWQRKPVGERKIHVLSSLERANDMNPASLSLCSLSHPPSKYCAALSQNCAAAGHGFTNTTKGHARSTPRRVPNMRALGSLPSAKQQTQENKSEACIIFLFYENSVH